MSTDRYALVNALVAAAEALGWRPVSVDTSAEHATVTFEPEPATKEKP